LYIFLYFMCVFYCTSLGAAVSVLCALLSSHTYLCPCSCLYLFYDKINDNDDDRNSFLARVFLLLYHSSAAEFNSCFSESRTTNIYIVINRTSFRYRKNIYQMTCALLISPVLGQNDLESRWGSRPSAHWGQSPGTPGCPWILVPPDTMRLRSSRSEFCTKLCYIHNSDQICQHSFSFVDKQ